MDQDAIVKVSNLSVSYNGKVAFSSISFSAAPKQIIGIIGPNGAGKSTLIKAIMGLVQADEGCVEIMNQTLTKACKRIAYVPQRNSIDFDFPVLVEDVVLMGRFPHLKWWEFPGKRDYELVRECLKQVDMVDYCKRQIGQLSGGQQQRVFLARALAQEAELFFLDEPFAGIDMASENMIMKLLKDLRDRGKTLFVVHHDLSKAETYFDSLILLKNKLIAYGKKDEVFQIDRLKEAYDGKVATFPGKEQLMVVNS
ncbi:metal ABC transporter ATP-binding protein [Desulfitibacter alkalitolerans]|uniref:metal ABC transporter ATP-binding protein n=1 Tax=Desulfitibacter alkalitolerans TaxID=264641 RepID=UPI000487414A|nr:metal ABC transporter ATP-binding protein [Desulfitibacter alkalitolerans]